MDGSNGVSRLPPCDRYGSSYGSSRAVAAWTNHSWRRLADTTARRTRLDTRFGRDVVEPWEIDLLFGWNEAEMEKEMQLHYAAMGLLDRIKQARITCMM